MVIPIWYVIAIASQKKNTITGPKIRVVYSGGIVAPAAEAMEYARYNGFKTM